MTFKEFVEQRLRIVSEAAVQGEYGDGRIRQKSAYASVEKKLLESLLRDYTRLYGEELK